MAVGGCSDNEFRQRVAAMYGSETGSRPGLDPMSFDGAFAAEYETRAANGFSHPVMTKSPGGVIATAERTARFRSDVEAVAATSSIQPDALEAIVFLESAGRPDVVAGGDVAGAAGLAQILAETGRGMLGMRVDLERSRALTRKIEKARKRGDSGRVVALTDARRQIDERFDPHRSLEGAVRYLVTAREVFGRQDLAIASYHMGIGNLETAIRRYAGSRGGDRPVADIVRGMDLSYARLYFDSTPKRHSATYRLLHTLSDDTSTYYFRVLAAAGAMSLFRQDPARLERVASRHRQKASAEEVLHPQGETPAFSGHGQIADAAGSGAIVSVPNDPAGLGFKRSSEMGELARRLGVRRDVYFALRPEALAALLYVSAEAERISGSDARLELTSAVRDERYQRLLVERNVNATRGFSLHTTGYAFDIDKDVGDPAKLEAVRFLLRRLQALWLVAYVEEPGAFHVTASGDAADVLARSAAVRKNLDRAHRPG